MKPKSNGEMAKKGESSTSHGSGSTNDTATARLLYAIIKQKSLKDIDWNKVAHDPVLAEEISNGHAARMRFSRFRALVENRNKPRQRRRTSTTIPSSSSKGPDVSTMLQAKVVKPKRDSHRVTKPTSRVGPHRNRNRESMREVKMECMDSDDEAEMDMDKENDDEDQSQEDQDQDQDRDQEMDNQEKDCRNNRNNFRQKQEPDRVPKMEYRPSSSSSACLMTIAQHPQMAAMFSMQQQQQQQQQNAMPSLDNQDQLMLRQSTSSCSSLDSCNNSNSCNNNMVPMRGRFLTPASDGDPMARDLLADLAATNPTGAATTTAFSAAPPPPPTTVDPFTTTAMAAVAAHYSSHPCSHPSHPHSGPASPWMPSPFSPSETTPLPLLPMPSTGYVGGLFDLAPAATAPVNVQMVEQAFSKQGGWNAMIGSYPDGHHSQGHSGGRRSL